MRKWAFFIVATAAVIIGCGGSGSGGGTTNAGGNGGGSASSTTAGQTPQMNIPTPPHFSEPPGFLDLGFLTGQGRAAGDLTLEIKQFSLSDEFGEIKNDLSTNLSLGLSSYTFNIARLLVDFNGQNSRLFETYTLNPLSLDVDQGGPITKTENFAIQEPDGSISNLWPPNPIQINGRVFPGRETLVPIYLDDSMFSVQTVNGRSTAVFDEQRFQDINQPPIKGFLADYVGFDISAMPANKRPQMSPQSGSVPVTKVFLTGDNYAVAGAGDSGNFEMLTLFVSQPIVGTYRVPSGISGIYTPGTFTLKAIDPTDIFNLRTIVALQGTWNYDTHQMTGFGQWNMVTFPNSTDGFKQEVVLFKEDSNGNISDFYFGYLDYDLKQIKLYPVKGLVNGIVNPGEEITISITGQFDKTGSPTIAPQETRTGTYSVTTQGALPADAPTSGSFLVYRI